MNRFFGFVIAYPKADINNQQKALLNQSIIMKYIITILFIYFTLALFGQGKTIVFDRVLHDFELIEEERGMVITEFKFRNESKEKFTIVNSKTSCNCAVVGFSNKEIRRNDTVTVTVMYDPTGLPGKFSKSIELTFEGKKGRRIKRYLTIKGITVSLTAKNIFNNRDTLQREKNVIHYYKQEKIDKKIDFKNDAYKKLIKKSTQIALMHKSVRILITIYHHKEDFAFEKILKDSYNRINKDLINEGIPEQNIIFLDPKVELSSQEEYLQVSIINQDSYSTPNLTEDIIAEISTYSNGKEKRISVNSSQQKSLPIYFQYFRGGLRDIDTASSNYKAFLEELTFQIKGKEEIVEFLVVSSASNWVYSSDKFDNQYIATLRGDISTETLKKELKNNDIAIDKISFSKNIKIIGPQMNKRNYVPYFYRKFQYLKIIPVYKVEANDKRGANGFIHYYQSSTEALDPQNKLFFSFVNQLEYLIKTKGYAKIRMEGSSSNTTSRSSHSNEKLAYVRIEDLKENLEKALYKRGVNPQRLEITEETTIVQRTETNDIENSKKVQYVKAVLVN